MFLIRFATFFTGLGPIIKIGSIAVLVIGLWFGVTWYNNKQRNIGAKKAQAKIFALMQVESEEEWTEKILQISKLKSEVDADKESLDQEYLALEQDKQIVSADRRVLSREITFAGNEFARRIGNVGTQVSSVLDSDLFTSIHNALADLRQFDAERDPVSFDGGSGSEATTSSSGRTP